MVSPSSHGWWLMCSHNCEQIEHHLDITWTSLGHLFIDGLVLPIHLEVLDALGCHAVRIGIVQRERRKLFEQDLLGIVVVLDGRFLIGRRSCLIEELSTSLFE